MASEWPIVQLSDVASLLTGFPFQSKSYIDDQSAPRLLRGDNLAQGTLRWDGAKRWPKDNVADLAQFALREGDVVVAMDRPWIEAGLKYAAVRELDLPSYLVQRVARLRGSPQLDTRYLKYVIGGQGFTNHVLAVQTGTAIPHISGEQIQSFRFALPPLHEQRVIAHVLGALDDKIELNRRMNETLEAMARALFKAWLVDFKPLSEQATPSTTKDSSTCGLSNAREPRANLAAREVPAGWSVMALDEIAVFTNGLALQKFPAGNGLSLPVIKIAQLNAGHTRGADAASVNIDPTYVVDDGDIVFSWSGSLECKLWAGGRGALNQHLFKITSATHPKWLAYLGVLHHLPEFRRIAAGKATTMGHIQRHHLSDAKLAVPSPGVLAKMDHVLQPIVDSIWRRNVQSRTLASIRAALLPKLISGELRVNPKLLAEVSSA